MTEHAKPSLADLYREACVADVTAFKPGNVSLASPGHGMTADAFLRSADASAPHMARAGIRLGRRVWLSVSATRSAVGCNTNLGIVLLCAPLIQAAMDFPRHGLRDAIDLVLDAADAADGDAVFAAIRLAAPGGLGEVAEHDVATRCRVRLTEAMHAAAAGDAIARQYANGFADLFDDAVPALAREFGRTGAVAPALTGLFLHLLSRHPDTHIRRKHGAAAANRVMQRAAEVRRDCAVAANDHTAYAALRTFDGELKRHGLNPGTTADLCVASLLMYRLLTRTVRNPGDPGKPQHAETPHPAESAATVH